MKLGNFTKPKWFRRARTGEVYSNLPATTQTNKPRMQIFNRNLLKNHLPDFLEFLKELSNFIFKSLRHFFMRLEVGKTLFAAKLYRQRGKNAKRFVHSGMAVLAAFGIMIAPVVAKEFPGSNLNATEVVSGTTILSATSADPETTTDVSAKPRDKVVDYIVQEGDTISTIADKFSVSADTVLWENDLTDKSKIKPGQTLKILSVTGVSHKVQKGDTVYSIAKKYDSSPQAIADFPYNTFVNDETFELAIGETIVVPDGVKKNIKAPATPRTRQLTPDAGSVTASGAFVWPTNGTITQRFSWYHPAIDIANKSMPDVLAADSGKVIAAGWDSTGYGNKILIDHGNGYITLYGHLSKFYVVPGQTVSRGSAIGRMGSTGRSTGPHLHCEIRKGGTRLNPLSFL
jgi:murein DD-endopeptidase MepM/ murein hydrolase activator NlpD